MSSRELLSSGRNVSASCLCSRMVLISRSSPPTICRPGTFKDSQEESDCVLCPKGLYCVEGVALPCPAGTYGAKEGLHRLKDCTGFTVWRAAHKDPPPNSCVHKAIIVKKAQPPHMGHLAQQVQQANNWDKQVGQPAKDAEKDVSVRQALQVLDCPVHEEDTAQLALWKRSFVLVEHLPLIKEQ
ncbi:hypothetical protein WMY93_028723 [Mugilogobius chulae]|uniref:TNFR-Cys domain-containing protein n=1 Tax=Mugilogobius chulae TaxID=88201 RepID=A0AAW0N040_9GOBI